MKTAAVEVALSGIPFTVDKPYTYFVPQELQERALPGVRVIVPFGKGNRRTEGMILSRKDGIEREKMMKPVLALLDESAVISREDISLALWMRNRYFCPVYDALHAILPAGLWYQFEELWFLNHVENANSESDHKLVDYIKSNGQNGCPTSVLQEEFGSSILNRLLDAETRGIFKKEIRSKKRVSDKTHYMVSLSMPADHALSGIRKGRGSAVRAEVIKLLAESGCISATDLSYYTGVTLSSLKAMERAGWIKLCAEEVLRIPSIDFSEDFKHYVLNEEQQNAKSRILDKILARQAQAILLHGVTGSGKTQVYIQLVEEVIKRGMSAIVLVPEIILTPQLLRIFGSHFGEKAALLHSGLKLSERYDQWKRIRRGEVQVVLGTRSAVFAPVQNLGLIILDEEQENSYRSENMPCYHAADIAKYRCAQNHCVLLLGSATPRIETYYQTGGNYDLIQLRNRFNQRALPKVIIADLKQELRSGNGTMIGSQLRNELEYNIANGEQSILLINRRGNSRMLNCTQCGYVPECVRCSVAMTYHSANHRLMCHYCGHSEKEPEICPKCGGTFKKIGFGTQKVEEELSVLFPNISVLRMDADTAANGHDRLLEKFKKEQIPILLGTQMIAKGLDFENVTLVGVLLADSTLYLDHYLSAERTFNLLTQVVGRAGRGSKPGRAVIQTFTPENDVVVSAAAQDYDSFYSSELRLRRAQNAPPFCDRFMLTLSGQYEHEVLLAAAETRDYAEKLFAGNNLVLGPAPAPVLKLNDLYRYRITICAENHNETRAKLSQLIYRFSSNGKYKNIHLKVDCNAPD